MNIQDRAFGFACSIVGLHRELVKRDATVRLLAGQLLRSGTSIGANLEEATAGQSRADFISKCSIALKEARETCYWLKLLCATGLLSPEEANPLLREANELVAILTTIVKNSKNNR
jgi:four helix bundle protein